MSSISYAYECGCKYFYKLLKDKFNFPFGPALFESWNKIPDEEYERLEKKFGKVTNMMESSFRRGYNHTAFKSGIIYE